MTRSDLRRIRAERRVRRSRPALYATGLLALGAWFGYKLRSRAENGARQLARAARLKAPRIIPIPPDRGRFPYPFDGSDPFGIFEGS